MKALTALRNSYEKNWPEVHAALTGSLPSFIYSRQPGELESSIPVFCYHLFDSVEFERDLEFLQRNDYVTLDAQALVDHLLGTRPAPPRSVVLSVDDGAGNLFATGFPLLQRFNMTAVAFIVPRFHAEEFTGPYANGGDRPCTWPEIREMHESGLVDFQSHTYEHRYVPRWPEPIMMTGANQELIQSMRGPAQSMTDDFRISKELIEHNIGKSVNHLAFVKYNGSEEAIRIGRECGYESFWWGYLPGHAGNRAGQSPNRVTRIDAIYLRRLPGQSRKPLRRILGERYGASVARMWGRLRGHQSEPANHY